MALTLPVCHCANHVPHGGTVSGATVNILWWPVLWLSLQMSRNSPAPLSKACVSGGRTQRRAAPGFEPAAQPSPPSLGPAPTTPLATTQVILATPHSGYYGNSPGYHGGCQGEVFAGGLLGQRLWLFFGLDWFNHNHMTDSWVLTN